MRSTKAVRFRSLQNAPNAVSYVHPGVSLKGETGSYLYPTTLFSRIGIFFPDPLLFLPGRLYRNTHGGAVKTRKSSKNMIYRAEAIDKRHIFHIMKATEQSMIEARSRISSTIHGGGDRRCERPFRRRVSAFPDGYAWDVGQHPADCRSFSKGGGELSDNRRARKNACHEQYLLCS